MMRFTIIAIVALSGPAMAECSEQGAIEAARSEIEENLRAPHTAIHPEQSEVRLTVEGDCLWSLRSYVDAENGFGALLRMNYEATIAGGDSGYVAFITRMDQ